MGIAIGDVSKFFGDFAAVGGVTFDVNDGEFVSLLGPSGSGKSTLLRCIAGLEDPTSGRVSIEGEDVTHVPVQDRKVGFVFQHFALFRHMSVLENVAFGLRVRGVGKEAREKRAREFLVRFGLEGFERRRPHQLSGGQRQRVALARALAPEPSLLLLDEPFGALDTRLRKELRIWLRELHLEHRLTTLLVTHDQEEAMEVSDRVIVMNRGRIEQDGTPRDVYSRPSTPFVAAFVGEVNRVRRTVAGGAVHVGAVRIEVEKLPDGIDVDAVFRPTDLFIGDEPGPDRLPAVIREMQFFGGFEAVRLEGEGGLELTAHVPTWAAEERNFKEGRQVHVLFASRPRIFPVEPRAKEVEMEFMI